MEGAAPREEQDALAAGLTPWVTIATRPRATIRAIVDANPRRHVWLLAAASGLGWPVLGGPTAVRPLLFFIAPVGAVVLLYVNGALVRWTGSWLGGSASSAEVRAALAWSNVPTIFLLAIRVAASLLGADLLFAGRGALAWTIFRGLVSLWVSGLTLVCLAEVHRFSMLRATWSLLLAGLLLALPVAIVAVLALLVLGAGSTFMS